MTDERMRIEYWPMSPIATVVTGSVKWARKSSGRSNRPVVLGPERQHPRDVGNQRRTVAKTTSSSMPMTKYGIE